MYYINYFLRKNYFRNIKNISKKQLSTYSYSQYGGGGNGNGGGGENYFFIPFILASFYYFSKK